MTKRKVWPKKNTYKNNLTYKTRMESLFNRRTWVEKKENSPEKKCYSQF